MVSTPRPCEEKPAGRVRRRTAGCSTPSECIGEIVNKSIAPGFEGYYKNDEANAQRMRNGWYWSGDLGYRDKDGWFYFAGRDFEWLRVDGENFARRADREDRRALSRASSSTRSTRCPTTEVGDQVMVALQVADPVERSIPPTFDAFLAEQTRPRHQVVAALRARHRPSCP